MLMGMRLLRECSCSMSRVSWDDIYFLNSLKKDYLFVYSFMRDTQRGRDLGRERSRLSAGRPMWDSIPGPQDHLIERQARAPPGVSPGMIFNNSNYNN